jgi:hypothetical protein
LNWQRRAEEKRRAEEEERRAEMERAQRNAHLDAIRERNIEGINQRRSAQEEELLKKEKERQLIKEVISRIICMPILFLCTFTSVLCPFEYRLFGVGSRKTHFGARAAAPRGAGGASKRRGRQNAARNSPKTRRECAASR